MNTDEQRFFFTAELAKCAELTIYFEHIVWGLQITKLFECGLLFPEGFSHAGHLPEGE